VLAALFQRQSSISGRGSVASPGLAASISRNGNRDHRLSFHGEGEFARLAGQIDNRIGFAMSEGFILVRVKRQEEARRASKGPRKKRTRPALPQGAWFGWPNVPELEKLVTDWVRAADQSKRKQVADDIQKVALSEVTYVPVGRMGAAHSIPKEQPGRPQVRSADFLEREGHVGPIRVIPAYIGTLNRQGARHLDADLSARSRR